MPARTQTTVAAPTGTSDTVNFTMQGLGASYTLSSPLDTATVTICGTVTNTLAVAGGSWQIYYGTGTAPANSDAVTGTAIGILQADFARSQDSIPFSITAIFTGNGTDHEYWVDLALRATLTGTVSMANVTVTVE